MGFLIKQKYDTIFMHFSSENISKTHFKFV